MIGDIVMSSRSKPDRGDVALVDVDEVLVDPAVGLRAVGVEGLLVGAAADVAHRADAAALDLRARARGTAPAASVSQTCGGSTTWSSTLMILGSSASIGAPGD